MVEEKAYYRCVGEHSQRWGHLGWSGADITKLSWALLRDECQVSEMGTRCSSQKAKVTKLPSKNVWIT